MPWGSIGNPPLAIAAYAAVKFNNDTTLLPRARLGSSSSFEIIPKRFAVFMVKLRPIVSDSLTVATLYDIASACRRETLALYVPSKFFGRQFPIAKG